jgi:hypothetical protein
MKYSELGVYNFTLFVTVELILYKFKIRSSRMFDLTEMLDGSGYAIVLAHHVLSGVRFTINSCSTNVKF